MYDAVSGEVQQLEENIIFSPNHHQGSIAEPVPFHLQTTGIGDPEDEEQLFELQPNPFRDETVVRVVLPSPETIVVSISDMNGKTVFDVKVEAQEGLNTIPWNGLSETGDQLSSGVYVVRLKTGQGILTRKVVLQR